ncbi:TetR/AcrR family transcriptional regulator [Stackebrandtia soli]|uniref:TetR/AcrR family transcriptional regulator n=1 Tax=Stackebrandtia soli TaxID=1892856 RepID=UPI0039E7CA8A
MGSVTTEPLGRRARTRANTLAEIKATARRHLVEQGPSGISLRAIARDMGVSAPALYRYFPSLDALITQLCVDLYVELRDVMRAECDTLPEDALVERLVTAAKTFRRWAVEHRPEFTLMFASLAPGAVIASPGCATAALDPETEPYKSILMFARIFGDMFERVYHQSDAERGFALRTPRIPELPPELHDELLRSSQAIGANVPIEFAYTFQSFWIRLYGLVAMEVFGQLPVVEQAEAMLDAELATMAEFLGATIEPSTERGRA